VSFQKLFPEKPLIGMIHMPPLPGAPGNTRSMKEFTDFALSEADKLEGAALDACIVENVGDTPLFKENLPPYSVAAMALVTRKVVEHTRTKVGVNTLRNACEEALSVAHVAGGQFIRCNVLIGSGISLANIRKFYDRSDGIITGEPDFKVGGVWGGPSDAKAYAKAVRLCRH